MSTLSESDRRFLQAFESCQLSRGGFRHRDHVRLAYIYLRLHDREQALELLRSGLQRFLAHLGAPPSMYHETLTQAWLLAVDHFLHCTGATHDFDGFAAEAGWLLEKENMRTHYTPELLMSEEARVRFLEPDLEPIPRHSTVV